MSIFSTTLENVESHYIDNQTMCISIPRWNPKRASNCSIIEKILQKE